MYNMAINNTAPQYSSLIANPSRAVTFYVVMCFALFSGAFFGLAYSEEDYIRQADTVKVFGQIFQLPAYLLGLYALVRHSRSIIAAYGRSPALLLLIGLAIVSVCWSIDWDVTMRRSVLLFFSTTFGVALAVLFDRHYVIKCFVYAAIVIFSITLTAAVFFPSVAIHHDQWYPAVRGFFTFKNTMGQVAALGVFFGLMAMSIPGERKTGLLAMALSGIALVFSLSATALVCAIAVVVMNRTLKLLASARAAGAVLVLAVIVFLAVLIATGALDDMAAWAIQSLGKDTTLTGRDQIWFVLWNLIKNEAFFFGYGYEAFWTAPDGAKSVLWGMGSFSPPHAHNGILHLWASVGLFGVLAFCAMLAGYVVNGVRSLVASQDPLNRAGLLFLCFYIPLNIAASYILTYASIFWPIFVFFAINGAMKRPVQ